ncbi:MAG: class B sortase [Lachnospiraceae bacterium]|jgi:sortase B|nr:class B sortase [Lachnospiraceae bacterium]
MERKRRRKKRSAIPLIVLLTVCIAVLGFSAWQLAGIYLEYKEGTDEYEDLRQYVNEEVPEEGSEEPNEESGEREQRVAFDKLRELNEDVIGWIEIPDTQVNYPILKGDDDVYYLNHTFNDTVNSSGSIFMEVLNSPDFTDLHTIIYGHNMKNGAMFGELKEYKSPSFLVEHPLIYIDQEDGTHAYEIFSCYETSVKSDSYTIGFERNDEYSRFLEKLKERSAYDTGVEVSVLDSVISLSTCDKSGKKRYLVHGKKIW